MASTPATMSYLVPPSGTKYDRNRLGVLRRALLAVATVVVLCGLAPTGAHAGPISTRQAFGTGEIVPIPASILHEEGDMIDRRIVPDLRWIAARFPIFVSDGYSGPLPSGEHAGCNNCHVKGSDHYNGLAVDIVPVRSSGKCDNSWRGITRLALWAEPVQGKPVPPFRWVGYDGDAGHGCGHHLHLSWEHAIAPQFQLAEWVEVFSPTGPAGRQPRPERAHPKPPAGPPGGFATIQSGGVSPAD